MDNHYDFPPIFYIWERKVFKSNGFFNKSCQAPNLYLTLRVSPIETNSHKFGIVRYVFVKNSGLF